MIYLYVKTHNITGLKYLGKTTQNPYIYLGSGTRWRNHYNKHGKNISTQILLAIESKKEIKETGLFFSKLWNIVESDKWANIKPENGDGGFAGGVHHPFYKKDFSLKHKQNISIACKLEKNGMYGKKHSSETKIKISNAISILKKGKKLSENHKNKIKYAHIGKIKSNYTKNKISKSLIGKKHNILECPYCNKIGGHSNMIRYHFNNCKNYVQLSFIDRISNF